MAIIQLQFNDQQIVRSYLKGDPRIVKALYQEIIGQAKIVFGDQYSVNTQRIAFILHTNRKKIQNKLK